MVDTGCISIIFYILLFLLRMEEQWEFSTGLVACVEGKLKKEQDWRFVSLRKAI